MHWKSRKNLRNFSLDSRKFSISVYVFTLKTINNNLSISSNIQSVFKYFYHVFFKNPTMPTVPTMPNYAIALPLVYMGGLSRESPAMLI